MLRGKARKPALWAVINTSSTTNSACARPRIASSKAPQKSSGEPAGISHEKAFEPDELLVHFYSINRSARSSNDCGTAIATTPSNSEIAVSGAATRMRTVKTSIARLLLGRAATAALRKFIRLTALHYLMQVKQTRAIRGRLKSPAQMLRATCRKW